MPLLLCRLKDFKFDPQRFSLPTDTWLDFVNDELAGEYITLTEENGVITINNVNEFAFFATEVNGTDYSGKTIKLGADIDLRAHLWIPLGKINRRFKDTFDDDGHTISGLIINATEQNQGLFGYVLGGTIKNVNLTGVNVTSTTSYVGGLVGFFTGSGSIENCTVSGKVEGTGDSSQYISGLAGRISDNGTVKNNLVFDATVSGNSRFC